MKLFLASGNPGKLLEIQDLLKDLPIQLVTPKDLNLNLDILESGASYKENAARKALAYSTAAHLLTLADDSGLEVGVLDGAPGVHSHRFAPQPGATDADRRRYLLTKLRELPRPWQARFRCVIALATPLGEVEYAEGACDGEIIPQERGEFGFGYDPVFLVEGTDLTMAELPMEQKNRLSHRAGAVIAIRPALLRAIRSQP